MGSLSDACPRCGSETSDGDEQHRAFVRYDPAPNDAQQECEWGQDLPDLRALVCTDCGCIIGVIDTSDPEGKERQTNRFRVDEELR